MFDLLYSTHVQKGCNRPPLTFHSQEKQAENGLQSRSSENGSVALWIEIAVMLNYR